MESSLRHILHLTNSEVNASANHEHGHLSLDGGRNLSIDELSQDNHVLDNGDTTASRKRPNPSSRLSYPRKRAIRACQKCRVRRTKCDNVRPSCTACLDLGAECVYSEGDPSTCVGTSGLSSLENR